MLPLSPFLSLFLSLLRSRLYCGDQSKTRLTRAVSGFHLPGFSLHCRSWCSGGYMVLNTELLNAPQGNNSQCIYSTELYGDGKLLPSVEETEMEGSRQEAGWNVAKNKKKKGKKERKWNNYQTKGWKREKWKVWLGERWKVKYLLILILQCCDNVTCWLVCEHRCTHRGPNYMGLNPAFSHFSPFIH